MKKVLAICMALVLVVALPLAASAEVYTYSFTSDNSKVTGFWYIRGSDSFWSQTSNYTFEGSLISASASGGSWSGWAFNLLPNDGMRPIRTYEKVTITMDVDWHSTSISSNVSGLVALLSDKGAVNIPISSYKPGSASGNAEITYSGIFALEENYDFYGMQVIFRSMVDVPLDLYISVGNINYDVEIVDKDAYNTAQIIDQIHTSTDDITGKIDDSTGQIVGELDEIQSDIKGDDWTSPAPGKDDELNGAMSDYDDAYNEAVGGKSDQEIVDEVSGQVDYDYGALDQQSVSGVTGFLSDLLDSFGADYKSLLMLSLTIGLAVYVIGRRVSSA